MKKREKKRPLGLYVHWPFCVSKCPYCDFNSHVRDSYDLKRWEKALIQDISWAHKQAGSSHTLRSIFFGGGTPSLMPPSFVAALIQHISALWAFEPDLEITLEANPTSAEAKKFEGFARAGVNRLSLGVQSFSDQELGFLGRAHTGLQATKALSWAQEFFPRFSFDLIYGLPGQKTADWCQTLEKALSFSPRHLSCYQLTYEPGTAFYQRFLRGDLAYPSEDLAIDLYETTSNYLRREGLKPYEVSNYAVEGEACRHNLLYWRYQDYVGVGPGSHGRLYQEGEKYALRHLKTPEAWLASVESHTHGLEEKLVLSPREIFMEWLLMGLRLQEDLNLALCEELTDKKWQEWISPSKLASLEREGFLKIEGNLLTLSSSGRLLGNKIAQSLLEE